MVLLSVRGVGKSFAVPVLSGVDLGLHRGEVQALIGANGAGKSTLTRILCGLTSPDAGSMWLDGTPYAPATRRDAEAAGVQFVLQELNLIDTLSVAENLFLPRLPRRFGLVDRGRLDGLASQALSRVGLDALDPRTPAGHLGIGQKQLVEIAAALARPCRVLVLDEPTAALTALEVDLLLEHVRRLRAAGVAILYVSHRLEEIGRIADRVTVLRDGRVVATRGAVGLDHATLVALITGASAATRRAVVPRVEARQAPAAAAALRVEGLRRTGSVRDVTFEVARGEIVGLYGLVGAGRTETLRAISGADTPESGRILRNGRLVRIRRPRDGVRAGIGMVPEDRKAQALLLRQTLRFNIGLAVLPSMARAGVWIDATRERERAEAVVADLDVRCRSIEQPVSELSGGNQQKIVLARWLLRDPEVLLLDEPTRGVDIGAQHAMHRAFAALADRGKALVVASSDLDELMTLCDRIVVISAGRVTGSFARGQTSREQVMGAAFAGYATTAEGGEGRPA